MGQFGKNAAGKKDSLSTQIGGKYARSNLLIFSIKKNLQRAGVHVSHPLGDDFIYSDDDVTLAFDPRKLSFKDVERDYYASIATSDFHTVCNSRDNNVGYVGESAALEIAYAIAYSRPVVFQYRPAWKAGLNPTLLRILEVRRALFYIVDMTTEAESLLPRLTQISSTVRSYKMQSDEIQYIDASVKLLLATLPSPGC